MPTTDDLIAEAARTSDALTLAVATAQQAADAPIITTPGVIDGMPEDRYHADPVAEGSLSSTGARRLLPPYCPAIYRWEQDHPTPATRAMELGSIAHRYLLGSGPELHPFEKIDGRTKEGKAQARELDDVRAAGLLPVSTADHERVTAMVDALRRHRTAAALFDPAHGAAEQSAFWRDPLTGAWCRGRYDWLPAVRRDRLIFPDYKTMAGTLDDDSIDKHIARYSYHLQMDWYETGGQTLGLAALVTGVLVFQMTTPPYLVRVVQPNEEARSIARRRNRAALDTFARCQATGHWPGYGEDIYSSRLPLWAVYDPQED